MRAGCMTPRSSICVPSQATPVSEHSGILKHKPSGRSFELNPEADFTSIGYITSFPEGN